MGKHVIEIDAEKCIGCGLCKKDCPAHNIKLEGQKAVVKNQRCIQCGHCVAVCPRAAVSMTGFPEPPVAFEHQPLVDSEQLLQALRARRSIRQFTEQEIPLDVLKRVIEAGRWTPTAKNANSVSYLVLQKERARAEALAVRFFQGLLPFVRPVYPAAKGMEIDEAFFFKGAPVAVAIVSKDKVSASLAASNMALMAESQGLGVLYSGFFTIAANMSPRLRRLLGVSGKNKLVTTLVLGYPAVRYHRSTQKEPAQVQWR